MSAFKESGPVKLDLHVGVESYTLKGEVLVAGFYNRIIEEMGRMDFLILQGDEDVLTIKMRRMLGLGELGPREVVLPGDVKYEEKYGPIEGMEK